MCLTRCVSYVLLLVAWTVQAQPVSVFSGIAPKLQYVVEGKAAGPSTQVVQTLLQEAGIEYDIHISNWARSYKLFAENPQSLMYSIVRTPEREADFHWLAKLGVIDLHIGRKKTRTELRPVRFGDLKGFSMGVVRNAFTHRFVVQQGLKEGEDYFLVATPSELMQLIQHDKIDYVFYEPTISPEIAKAYGLAEDYLVPTTIPFAHRYELYLVANPDVHQDTVNTIQQTHQRLMSQSTDYQQLLKGVLPASRRHREGH